MSSVQRGSLNHGQGICRQPKAREKERACDERGANPVPCQMLGHQISILQANTGARPGSIVSILNDNHTTAFDALCISGPYIFVHARTGEPAVNRHSGWGSVIPKQNNSEASSVRHSVRAALWVSNRVNHQEDDTGLPGIAAAMTQMEVAQLLLISVYVPYERAQEETDLQQRIASIQDIIQKTRRGTDGALHTYVGGDFDRHSNV
jgi:hypothetical protein